MLWRTILETETEIKIIKQIKRKAFFVLLLGGACFVLSLASFFYAEYKYKTLSPVLKTEMDVHFQKCISLLPQNSKTSDDKISECKTNAQIKNIKDNKKLLQAMRPYFWTYPILLISLSTIFGYAGLIWWGFYQPASKRPFIAIFAMGVLLQTILMIWIVVMRFVSLPF